MYLGDDSPASIIGHCRFKLKLKDGRIRTLLRVLHIPNLAINLISVRKMDVAGVKTVCGDGGCKMVRGSMVSMRGFWYSELCTNYWEVEHGFFGVRGKERGGVLRG